MSEAWHRAARVVDLDGAGPFAIAAGDLDLVVVKDGDGYRAYEGRCPHRGALLGEGEMEGNLLVCRNHRWKFDITTGQREGGPECLRTCATRVEGTELLVDVASLLTKRETPQKTRRITDLPGPPTLPFLGNAHQVNVTRLHLQVEAWARQYGTPFTYKLGPQPSIVFSDMDHMLPVFRDRPELFRRASALEPIFDELGVNGVFSAEGRAWRPQRKLSMEALSHRHLRGFYPTLAAVADRLRARWSKAAKSGETLDVAEELKRLTVDVTTQLVLGHDLDTLGAGEDVIQRKLGLLFPIFHRRLFAVVPYWRYVRLPSDRAADRALAEIRDWLGELIAGARKRLEEDPERAKHPRNFLEAMTVARDENGAPFSDEMIFGNALTMLLAGEDTTAYTLTWCIHHLLDATADEERLSEEARNALGAAAVPQDIDVANGLAFAGAVANEAMRLRPVAPIFFLEPLADTIVGDVEVTKGTYVALLIRPAAVDRANFGDPSVFRPARWVDPKETGGAHDPTAHQPFGSGPRICPGRTLALLEMKLALATIYKSFTFERVGRADEVEERFAFTMYPDGLNVRVRERRA